MEYNQTIALLIARVFLGVLFFLQGYDKVMRIKMPELIQTFRSQLDKTGMPDSILVLSTYYTSYIELIGGLLLILGLFSDYVLYALGLDLIMVGVAMGLVQPMWNMEFVFPRLVLLLTLLLVPGVDMISLDYLLNLK